MSKRTGNRAERILEQLRMQPMTVQQLSSAIGVTYLNAYYTVQSLKHQRQCHIKSWVTEGTSKPIAVYASGDGVDSRIGEGTNGILRADLMAADRAIRTAVAMWVINKEIDHDEEQQGKA